MHRTIRFRQDLPTRAALGDPGNSLARKAHICSEILFDAQRLVRVGQFGAPFQQLLNRACELLEEVDEVLVALDPEQDPHCFAAASALHRELERIQAAANAVR